MSAQPVTVTAQAQVPAQAQAPAEQTTQSTQSTQSTIAKAAQAAKTGASLAVIAAAKARTARQTASALEAYPGYVPLKKAALLIGRSTARTRQYIHKGKLGAKGEGWVRDEWGHLLVAVETCESFVPPLRGNARAAGVKASTHLRHAKATRRLILERFNEGDARGMAVRVINDLIGILGREDAEAKAGAQGTNMEGGSGAVPRSTSTTQFQQELQAKQAAALATMRSGSGDAPTVAVAPVAGTEADQDADAFNLDDIADTPLSETQ